MSAEEKFDPIRYDGTFTKNAALGAKSWFRCGGTADFLFEPDSYEDLTHFLKDYPTDEPLTILGGLANTIVRDGGIRGITIQLGKSFADITIQGTKIMAGAGALNGSVAAAAAKAGIGGLEFLSGIPGTVGGAMRMNAGAYGAEIKDIFVGATALERDGTFLPLLPDDMKFAYRTAHLPEGAILTSAVFEGKLEDKSIVKARLKEIKKKRQSTQPISEKTGGSTFANPEGDLKAWQVVEKVGGRTLQIGGARMSDKHLNFMINAGTATATDLEALGDELINRAKEQLGIDLRWEIKRVGEKSNHAAT